MAVIGHTHRPLFESLSRIDYLKFQIESLCRSYPAADAAGKAFLEEKIRAYQQDLQYTLTKDRKNGSRSSLYDSGRLVPCVFNSGCATGKRGITALEITGGQHRAGLLVRPGADDEVLQLQRLPARAARRHRLFPRAAEGRQPRLRLHADQAAGLNHTPTCRLGQATPWHGMKYACVFMHGLIGFYFEHTHEFSSKGLIMATLQVKGMDDDLYEALKGRAKRDNRSITQEVVTMIRESLARSPGSFGRAS